VPSSSYESCFEDRDVILYNEDKDSGRITTTSIQLNTLYLKKYNDLKLVIDWLIIYEDVIRQALSKLAINEKDKYSINYCKKPV